MIIPLRYFWNRWMWEKEHREISGLNPGTTVYQYCKFTFKFLRFSEPPFLPLWNGASDATLQAIVRSKIDVPSEMP